MTSSSLLAYAAAVMIAVATPGPAMMALVARGLSRGTRAAMRMAMGIAIGDLVLGSVALLGLSALLALHVWVFVAVKYVAAIYLVWLGVRMWRSPHKPLSEQIQPGRRDFLFGLLVALGNPKAILFHASLMPLIIDLHQLDSGTVIAVLAIIFWGNLLVMGGYALAVGAGARRLTSASRLSWMGRLAGSVMVGTGSLIAVH